MLYALLPVAVIVVLLSAGYLFRRQLRKSARFTQVVCPTCDKVPPRVHRNLVIRVLSAVVPMRMYGCRTCKRTFIRVKPLREQVATH